jgi:hypothetical protein
MSAVMGEDQAEAMKELMRDQPIGRKGRPDEIAAAALWLCSPAASFVLGVAQPVDGGFTAHCAPPAPIGDNGELTALSTSMAIDTGLSCLRGRWPRYLPVAWPIGHIEAASMGSLDRDGLESSRTRPV